MPRNRDQDDDDERGGGSLAARLYATESKRLKPLPEKFMRRTVCRFWKEGRCHLPKCTWAHGEAEIGTLVEIIPGQDDRPELPKKEKRELTPQETTLLARLEVVAQERDRIAAMEAAGNSAGGLGSLSGVLGMATGGVEDLGTLQEMQAAADLQAYQQQLMSGAQGSLEDMQARGTPGDLIQLQAKAMAVGTFGFGVGPLGEMDLTREFSSPFIGKGISRIPKQPVIASSRVYMGIVKAFYASQKHGRIECEEIRAATGCDVYIFQDVLARCQAGVGDVCCFGVHTSARGQLQASSPLVRTATHLGYAQTGIFRTGGPCDHKTDVGTIDCPDIRRVFGIEARVPKEIGKGLIFGRRVAFNSYMNTEGKVYVVSVEEVDESYTPTPGNLSVSYSMPAFAPLDQQTQQVSSVQGGGAGAEQFVQFDPMLAGMAGVGNAGPSRAEIEEKRRLLEEKKRAYRESRGMGKGMMGGCAAMPDPAAVAAAAAAAVAMTTQMSSALATMPEVAALQAALAAPVLLAGAFQEDPSKGMGKGGQPKAPGRIIPPREGMVMDPQFSMAAEPKAGGFGLVPPSGATAQPKAAMFGGTVPKAGGMEPMASPGGQKRKRERSAEGPRYNGTIKNLINKGTQGSIMCDELYLRFGKPIAVQEEDVIEGSLSVGAKVTFAVQEVGGVPLARDCEVEVSAAQPNMMGLMQGLWPGLGGMA